MLVPLIANHVVRYFTLIKKNTFITHEDGVLLNDSKGLNF